jgi:hypothetical protein
MRRLPSWSAVAATRENSAVAADFLERVPHSATRRTAGGWAPGSRRPNAMIGQIDRRLAEVEAAQKGEEV